jgi:hypothetical protein
MDEKDETRTVLTFTLAKPMQFLARSSLLGCSGYEEVTGNIPDISEFLDFNFWGLVWYCAETIPSISEHNQWLV